MVTLHTDRQEGWSTVKSLARPLPLPLVSSCLPWQPNNGP
jgi:hypothetical protein